MLRLARRLTPFVLVLLPALSACDGGEVSSSDPSAASADAAGALLDGGASARDATRPGARDDGSVPPSEDARAPLPDEDAGTPLPPVPPPPPPPEPPPPPAPPPPSPPPPGSFWHVESPADSARTWLVDPAGQRVFVLGVNTVMRNTTREGAPRCEGIAGYIGRTDPTSAAHLEWARLSDGESGGRTVPRPYGFNSVGAWSDTNDFDATGGDSYLVRPIEAGGAGAPYTVVLSTTPRGADRALKSESGEALLNGVGEQIVGDPFNPAFLADLDAMVARDVVPRRDDPRLQMWFMGNEDGMFDVASHGEGVRDFRRWIWSDVPAGSSIDSPLCARHALAAFLRDRYAGDIAALGAAWEASHASFASIVDSGPRPVPYAHDCNFACREDLQRFVHDRLVTEWVRAVTTRVRAADPNHLVASPRLALSGSPRFRFFAGRSEANPDVWLDTGDAVGTDTDAVTYCPFDRLARDGNSGFDVIAVNVYEGDSVFERPWITDGIHKLQERSGLPVLVSEFGVRARIAGWTNRGGAGSFVPDDDATDDQIQRGARYRTQIEQLVGFRGIVGAVWHAWSDRYMPRDPSLQIDMGLVQCDDPTRGMTAGDRWPELDDRMAETNAGIMALIAERTGL